MIITGVQVSEIQVSNAVETFIQAELINSSGETVKWYRGILTAMVREIRVRSLGELDEAAISSWQSMIYSQKRSAYTKAGHIRAMKRWLRWLHQAGILTVDLGSGLKMPRLPKSGRKGISEASLGSILAAARENLRDYALLMFLASTGCRRAGASGLAVRDLNLDEDEERLRRRATVREKGEKERTVLMDGATVRALEAWLEIKPKGELVFGLSPAGVSELVRRYAKKLGITGPVSPHQWRHRWARRAIESGMDLSQVSQLLGHEGVTITERFYGQFGVDSLQEAYERTRGRLG